MPLANDDLAALVYRFIADYGPLTASAVAEALGRDERRVGYALARLLDTRRLVVAGVTPAGAPRYAAAVRGEEERDG
jgi:hypothetical protein